MSTRFIVVKTGVFSTAEKGAMPKLKKLDANSLRKLIAKDVRIIREARKHNLYISKSDAAMANQKALESVLGRKAPHLVKGVLSSPEQGKMVVKGPNNKTFSVPLKSRSSLIRSLLIGNKIAKSDKHIAFVADHIKTMVASAAAKDAKLTAEFAKLPLSKPASKVTVSSSTKSLSVLLEFWAKSRARLVELTGYTPNPCNQEVGIGRNKNTATDMTGDMTEINAATRKTTLNPQGLFKTMNFPLKSHLTCVRNQGNRGTCDAFGVVAAVEAAVSVKYQKKVNLSEQALYKSYKLNWFPEPFYYGDGAATVFDLLAQLVRGYVFSYESDWDYNPSYSRVEHDFPPNLPPFYTHSADSYTGLACSETNHQANQVCYTIENKVLREVVTTVSDWVEDAVEDVAGAIDSILSYVTGQSNGHWVENTVTTWEEVITTSIVCEYRTDPNPSSGYRITEFLPFYFPLMNWEMALGMSKFFLDIKIPIIWDFRVMPSFDSASGGYVTNTEGVNDGALSRGGHCSLIAGYVDNSQLPSGVTPGEGGGYFIVKNSWGTQAGGSDCGYYYVPYTYVERWTTAMIALKAIDKV